MQQVQLLTSELNALNQSPSRPDLPSRERSALPGRQAQLQEWLKRMTESSFTSKDSLEPAYFGNERRTLRDKLFLAPPSIDGEWLPKSAVYALVDLMAVIFGCPKGLFKDCAKRIQSGLQIIPDELEKLGITDGSTEVDLKHSAIWMAGVYVMILMQFLENKVAVELTRSEFVEAQEALMQMKSWFVCFPTILQASESTLRCSVDSVLILLAVKQLFIMLKQQRYTILVVESNALGVVNLIRSGCPNFAVISLVCKDIAR